MSVDTSGGRPEMDYKQAVGTYEGFVLLIKASTIAAIVVLAGMAIFLT